MLGEYIARGTQAWIFAGTDERTGERIAASVLREPYRNQPDAERFLSATESARNLVHPNIIRTHAADIHSIRLDIQPDELNENETAPNRNAPKRSTTDYYPYTIMDFAWGGSLAGMLDEYPDKPLPAELAASYVDQAARGLAHAHANRVLHRDVKPANLLLDHARERLMITDFGIAVTAHRLETMTGTQLPKGTAPYMAPDQSDGRPTVRSDVYSLAVLAYRLLGGKLPINAASDDPMAWSRAHRVDKVPRFSDLGLDYLSPIAQAVEPVIKKALDKNPRRRHPSMEIFRLAFTQAATDAINKRRAVTIDFGDRTGGATQADTAARDQVAQEEPQTLVDSESLATVSTPHTRRIFLRSLALAATAASVYVSEYASQPETTRVRRAVYTIVQDLLAQTNTGEQPYDSYAQTFLRSYLIPFSPGAMAGELIALQSKESNQAGAPSYVPFLAARLAAYKPETTQTIMETYQTQGRYTSAAIAAMGLAAAASFRDNRDTYVPTLERFRDAIPQPNYAEAATMVTAALDSVLGNKATAAADALISFESGGSNDKYALLRALSIVVAAHDPVQLENVVSSIIDRHPADESLGADMQKAIAWMAQAAATVKPPHSLDVFKNLLQPGPHMWEEWRIDIAMNLFAADPAAAEAYIRASKAESSKTYRRLVAACFATTDPDFVREVQSWKVETDDNSKPYDFSDWLDVALDPTNPARMERAFATLPSSLEWTKPYIGAALLSGYTKQR